MYTLVLAQTKPQVTVSNAIHAQATILLEKKSGSATLLEATEEHLRSKGLDSASSRAAKLELWRFLSPEELMGGDIAETGGKPDVWALAMTIVYLMTGKYPYGVLTESQASKHSLDLRSYVCEHSSAYFSRPCRIK